MEKLKLYAKIAGLNIALFYLHFHDEVWAVAGALFIVLVAVITGTTGNLHIGLTIYVVGLIFLRLWTDHTRARADGPR